MNSKRILSLILLLTVILLFTGCSSNLLKKFAGKKIGVCLQIVDDSKYLSIEDQIGTKLIKEISKNKDLDVVRISPRTIKPDSTVDERMEVIEAFNLDYLLVLSLENLNYDIDFGSKKTGDLSFEFILIDKYKLNLTYYLYDHKNDDPVCTGESDGYFSKSRKTNAPVPASDLSYEFCMAVVNALKKTELSK